MKYLLILLISVVTPVSMAGSDAGNDGPKLVIRKFVETYWNGKLTPDSLEYVQGYEDDLTVKFVKPLSIDRRGTSIHVCPNSQVRFVGRMIWKIDAKSTGCKVGDLEAVEGTTITFSEGESNTLTAIVTAKPVHLRGYTWPAKSNLLFFIDDEINPMLYAVVLGEDLKGTPYKAGQKVYIGKLEDSDAKKSGPLSLTGQDPTL